MNKEYVPYELAEKLKHIGFNEPCSAMWQKNKKIWYCHKTEWLYNYQSVNFTTPLWQQAFDWFRDRGLVFEITDYASLNLIEDRFHVMIEYKYDGQNWTYYEYDKHKFPTYAQAKFSLLEELIKIYEDQKTIDSSVGAALI